MEKQKLIERLKSEIILEDFSLAKGSDLIRSLERRGQHRQARQLTQELVNRRRQMIVKIGELSQLTDIRRESLFLR